MKIIEMARSEAMERMEGKGKEAGAAEVDAGEEEEDEEEGVDPGEEEASAETVVTLSFMPESQWPMVPQAK